MRNLALFLSFWLGIAPALADSSFVAPTATGTAATGQIPGSATNDSANAGNVGENATAAAWSLISATNTFTNASPTVVTWTGHPYPINPSGITAVGVYTVTNSGGALPTGLSAATNYYFLPIDANTGHIATSVANALAGTFVNASSTGTGTQTGHAYALPTSNTVITIAALSLTGGSWDISGSNIFLPGATDTMGALGTSISLTDNTLDTTTPGAFVSNNISGTGTVLGNAFYNSQSIGPVRKALVTGPTTIFLVGRANVTVGSYTGNVGGFLKATRLR